MQANALPPISFSLFGFQGMTLKIKLSELMFRQ